MQTLRTIGLALGTGLLALLVAWLIGELAPLSLPLLLEPAETHVHSTEVMRDLSRMLGVALSMLVALCAIAIPLTANVYTPKLIELFVADRVNKLALGYFVVANAFVLWNAYVVFDRLSPSTTQLRVFVSMLLTLGALVLIVPYVGYVLRFLIPRTIVQRLENEVTYALDRAVRARPEDVAELRHEVLETIQYLGKIVLRSVDRYDRDTVFEGLRALNDVFHTYQGRKAALPPEWFRAARGEIQGLGPELIREAHRQQASVEVAILQEFSLVLPLAIGRLPEVVASLAASTRNFGVCAAQANDAGVREQVTLYFNTFLRASLQRRHPDTFYKFVYQYRRFAEEILDCDPEHVVRITFFLDYYGHQAVRMGLGFLINVVAYDIASLVELAFRRRAEVRGELLTALIELDRNEAGLSNMPGVVKAQLILAAKLHSEHDDEAVTALVSELQKLPSEQLGVAVSQILAAREENFWEIADRRRHLDHVEPRYRPALDALRVRLLGEDPALAHELLESSAELPAHGVTDRREDKVTTGRLARRAIEAESAGVATRALERAS
ncbi:MAG: DUF2254 domain-containing protein, partial [Planctomycetes bacterium]|nr:DUF2254 domain-containing protein [Planctomycetota bacterium]